MAYEIYLQMVPYRLEAKLLLDRIQVWLK